VSPNEHAIIRVFTLGGTAIAQTPAAAAPPLGALETRPQTVNGYRVLSRFGVVRAAETDEPVGHVIIQYGRRVSDTEATVARGEQGEAARAALRSSQRMRRLVADLLLLARTDVGRVAAHEPCDLAQVVVEAAGELGPVSGDHDIVLDVHPAVVEAARDELHRLTVNLVENALRHTPAGTQIHIWTDASNGEATLIVQDDGPGVPAELAPTLFERFVRGAGDRGGSFGLGLAIVKAVAESHGGSVALEPTEPGRGARFVVRLPAHKAATVLA